MRLVDERTGLEVIGADECLHLLQSRHLGRIGVTVAGRPLIMPINYVMDGDAVVFRSAEGTKFDAAVRGNFVAFEIDDADAEYHTGWSVLLTGVADEITDSAELERAQRLPLRPWAPGAKNHIMRIVPVTITGRRIAAGSPDSP